MDDPCDPNFLDLMQLPMVAGDSASALANPTSVVLSKTLADKSFPDGHAVGKTLTLNIRGGAADYRVTGIFKESPRATDAELQISALKQIPKTLHDEYWSHWGSERVITILRFGTSAGAQAYAGKLPGLVRRRAAKDLGDRLPTYSLRLNPLTEMHFQAPGRKLTTTTLGLVGLLTLLIAVVKGSE